MARIPDVNALGRRPVPQAEGAVVPLRFAASSAVEVDAARRVSGASNYLFNTAQRYQERQDRLALAKAKSTFLATQVKLEEEFQNDKDFGTF